MTTLSVVGKWELELPAVTPGDPWFVDWATKAPARVEEHFQSCYDALYSLRDLPVGSVREYFAGLGGQSLMIQSLFPHLYRHTATELSPAAVAHLQSIFPEEMVEIYEADAYNTTTASRCDLAVFDCGKVTVFQATRGVVKAALDRIFDLAPMGVVLTDIAGPRLHLNRRSYAPILGDEACDSYEAYLTAFASFLENEYGYRLHTCSYTRWSGVMSLVAPSYDAPGHIFTTKKG